MAQITRTEYVEIDGLPLATPAWEVTDLSPIYDMHDLIGDFPIIPYRRGTLAARPGQGPKRIDLPLVIFGDYDKDGAAYPDAKIGLRANVDEILRDVLGPVILTATGERLLRYHHPNGTAIRSASALVRGPLRPTPINPTTVAVSLDVLITGGVLRDETQIDVTSAVVADGLTDTLDVPNAGTAYQDTLEAILTGTATQVRISNLTADAGGDVWLDFNGSLGTGVTINTGAWSAVRDSVSVLGLVDHSGFERWLPLVAGVTNTLEIAPTGGTAQLQIRHYPAYL